LLILTAVLLGAALSFAYSYAPLHRANSWKIDYLEERLESRTSQVRDLEEQLEKATSSLAGTPSDDEVQALRSQLDEATKLAASREQEIEQLERDLANTARSRDTWKNRHTAAMNDLESRSEPAAERLVERPAAEPAPAAPAPVQPLDDALVEPLPEE